MMPLSGSSRYQRPCPWQMALSAPWQSMFFRNVRTDVCFAESFTTMCRPHVSPSMLIAYSMGASRNMKDEMRGLA